MARLHCRAHLTADGCFSKRSDRYLSDQRRQCFPQTLIFHAQLQAWHSSVGNTARRAGQRISEWHWETYQSLLSQKILPSLYDLTHVPSARLSSLPLFFFSKTNVSLQVFWSPCLPTGSTGFVSGPGGGTVVNAVWLTDSHFADAGSDWSSPCSSHMAAEYSSRHPFLVLSPTVPFCCTQRW